MALLTCIAKLPKMPHGSACVAAVLLASYPNERLRIKFAYEH